MATLSHPEYGLCSMRVRDRLHAMGYAKHGWRLIDYKPVGDFGRRQGRRG